jgi:hypothetical protein
VLLEFRENFVVESHLVAADRAPVSRIKGEDDGLSAQFAQGELLIGSDGKAELRSCFSGRQDVGHQDTSLMRCLKIAKR